jgi:hypothetical protein
MALQVQPLDEPLYKAEVQSPATTTEVATIPTVPAIANPVQRLTAQDLAAMGIEGASDEVNFFDYPMIHLKDRNFLETAENDADHGTELFIKNIRSTKQWLVRAVTQRGKDWIVADSSTDLFYTLQPPGTPDLERFNSKNDSFSEWKGARVKEGKTVEPEEKDKGGNDKKMYLMLSCVLAKPTKILPEGSEVIVQVMPSSANYRWPRFTKKFRAEALRLQASQGIDAVSALDRVVVRLFAGEKVTDVATAFYPLEFELAT